MNRMQAAALSAMFGGDDDQEPKISHEGQIARLREFAQNLKASCRFQVGQIVTPLAHANIRGDGEPHLVVEVLKEPLTHLGADPSAHTFAAVYDMKVACVAQGVDCLYLAWSGNYQAYPAA